MAVAGGTSPCLLLTIHEIDGRNVILILHRENRLIRDQVEIDGKKKTVPTGAAELKAADAMNKLSLGERVYVLANDFGYVKRFLGFPSCPLALAGGRYPRFQYSEISQGGNHVEEA